MVILETNPRHQNDTQILLQSHYVESHCHLDAKCNH